MNTSLVKLNKQLICVTIGDIEGIGIHLLLREFKKKNLKNFVLITNIDVFNKYIKYPKNKINLVSEINLKNYNNRKLNIYNIKTKNKNSNTIEALKKAYELTKKGFFIGIITLPLNKYKLRIVRKKFIDQTSFFSNRENQKFSNMIFYYKKNFFIPLTIHIELKKVHKLFKNKNLMVKKIKNIYFTLVNDFKIKQPKMILSGINPHAGENNIISKDDNKYLLPIINQLKKSGIYIHGPISGDGVINNENLKKYDAFIFTYHDQALIPFKILSNYKGVNFTSNLNIIRVSPSHGTAENLIGSNKAISKGVINCFNLLKKIHNNRN
ncbi:4-hydroxythreonine-4-phosphate dehydrogenase PdxA [Pelagibacteraceae bacterium]|nr:4-hydroxythreonine-4-phosphate dehydrogenase PdxA [Pelagibacteraceae bacterium]